MLFFFLGNVKMSNLSFGREINELKGMLNKLMITTTKIWTVVAPPMESAAPAENFPALPLEDMQSFVKWHEYLEDSDQNFYNAVSGVF